MTDRPIKKPTTFILRRFNKSAPDCAAFTFIDSIRPSVTRNTLKSILILQSSWPGYRQRLNKETVVIEFELRLNTISSITFDPRTSKRLRGSFKNIQIFFHSHYIKIVGSFGEIVQLFRNMDWLKGFRNHNFSQTSGRKAEWTNPQIKIFSWRCQLVHTNNTVFTLAQVAIYGFLSWQIGPTHYVD